MGYQEGIPSGLIGPWLSAPILARSKSFGLMADLLYSATLRLPPLLLRVNLI